MYPEEFVRYLVHFHGDRDYFECHEILEEYWKEVDARNKNSILVGWIQLAVCQYHHRRGNYPGALRMMQKALAIFQKEKAEIHTYGVNGDMLLSMLRTKEKAIEKHLPYESMYLPIFDSNLKKKCKLVASSEGLPWEKDSNLSHSLIVDKHLVRDRKDVIQDRIHALKNKNRKQ